MSDTTPFPLGAYLGNPDNSSAANEATFEANYGSFTQLMGAPPQYLISYVDQRQPIDDWVGNNMWLASSAAASPDARNATPVIGLPMASTADPSMTQDQYYQAFASGAYDSVIEQLVKTWADAGFTTQDWRPGWEMNLTTSPSYAGSDAQTQADWVAAFQHIYTVLHAAGAADGVAVQVIWNPSITNYTNAEATTNLYPGNAYVDAIGADVYSDMYPYNPLYDWDKNDGTIDSSLAQWMADPVNREHYWTYPAATPYSLDGSEGHSLSLTDLLQFAKEQGKPVAIPETGAGNSDGGRDVADDAAFPQWLAQTLQASGDQIEFVGLWDSNGGGNYAFSTAADGKPAEAAAWAQFFGASAAPITLGTGPDTLSLAIFESDWPNGTAFTVAVDGEQIGGSQTLSTVHAAGDAEVFNVMGDFAAGPHDVSVQFVAAPGSTDNPANTIAVAVADNGVAVGSGPFAPSANGELSFQFVATDDTNIPCFVAGTHIATPRGDVPVEQLAIGDQVSLLSGGSAPIKWIGRRSYNSRFIAGNRGVLPILIRRNALGDDLPLRDLLVSPQHALYLDDMLIPASALVNHVSILHVEAVEQLEYFHIELDSHGIVLAEGAAAETFVDDDSRNMFQNAGEFRALYPASVPTEARFCAPRVAGGEALDAVRRRLAARLPPATTTAERGILRGHLDRVDRERISGWALDTVNPDQPVRLRILDDGVVLGEVLADRYRADLERARIGHGSHAFELIIPGGLSPLTRHVICVQRASDGAELANSPRTLEIAADAAMKLPMSAQPVMASAGPPAQVIARGSLDVVTRHRVKGWAFDDDNPGMPVALQVLDNGAPIAGVLANHFREDLAAAGVGDGWHSFDVVIPGGLSPLVRHIIEVKRERDGAELPGSPMVIDAAGSFDAALEQAIANAVASIAGDSEYERVLSFMTAQTDRLLQQRSDAEGHRDERARHQQFRRRWGPQANQMPEQMDPGLRALVMDDRVPVAERDAGSQAILSHIRALQLLGYAVSFVAAEELTQAAETLEVTGITCCCAPFYASVEDVLRRQADCFDVVYLHRANIASRYLALVRRYAPRARIIYGVADLHHIRLAGRAAAEGRPELLAESAGMRTMEFASAGLADAVITHSATEAALLRSAVPETRVHQVAWDVPVRRTAIPFAGRHGLAFIGNYSHSPNVDAAIWLVEAVMPLVWQIQPDITCRLVGGNMPTAILDLARPGVEILGQVDDLHTAVFDKVRLTVAPLRYGAGIKGKVLASLAAGIPCVMSEVAADGMALPPGLRALVGRDAAALANLICRLHDNEVATHAASNAGLSLIRKRFSVAAITTALRTVLTGEQPARANVTH